MQDVSLAEAWSYYCQIKHINIKNTKPDISRWSKHIAPYFGDIMLSEIDPFKIVEFRSYLSIKLSPQSVHHCMSQVRRIINTASKWRIYSGLIPHFDMPRFNNKRVRFLTAMEAQQLLAELKMRSLTLHNIALFALNTGMRVSEIFNLTQSCINVNTRRIYLFDTKNVETRVIPVNKKALHVLHHYAKQNKNYLFTNKKGEPFKEVCSTFVRSVNACRLNHGIRDNRQKVVFHTLRHTFASWLVQSGEDLHVVQHLLGHKSLEMTQRYAHLAPAQGINAVQKLDSVVKSKILC